MKKTIYCLIDSHDYVDNNCYQHQISRVLSCSFNVQYVQKDQIQTWIAPKDSIVLSRLKLRTFLNVLNSLKNMTQHCSKFFVYEQDPWENYIINSPNFGLYSKIANVTPKVIFLNTSTWWSNLVNVDGMISKFVQMWMLPEYCIDPKPWSARKHDVVFCGTMYPRRAAFFSDLEKEGLKVKIINANKSYKDYLSLVSSCKIMIRSEKVDWTIRHSNFDNVLLQKPNALWIRDVENAACGCFTMREYDDEMIQWGLQKIPAIKTFHNVKNAVEIIKHTLSLNDQHAMHILKTSSDIIKNSRGWNTIIDAINS